jgi:copper(I)-binding protein
MLGAVTASLMSLPVYGEGKIMIQDAYARASGMNAKAGAAFFEIVNHSGQDDRLIAARSEVAKRVEIHTHKEDENGVMKMLEVTEGLPVANGGVHVLKRGADHVMFMGLNQSFEDGEVVSVTLVFENAGEMSVEIPVDLSRKPKEPGAMDHKDMDHSDMDHKTN